MISTVSDVNAQDALILLKIEGAKQQREQQEKAFNNNLKMEKTLSAVKQNSASKHAHGGKTPHAHVSVFYAVALAIVQQMENNLKTMSTQAEHMMVLDHNNENFSNQMDQLKKKSEEISDTTSGDSLTEAASISAQMNIVSNEISVNQGNEQLDANITQAIQTNSSSDKGVAQAILDADKAAYRTVK